MLKNIEDVSRQGKKNDMVGVMQSWCMRP